MLEHRASQAESLAARHLDAWAVEVLGDVAAVHAETTAQLVADKLLDPQHMQGRTIAGARHPVDPWTFAVLTGTLMAQAKPEHTHAMRSWTLSQWQGAIDDLLDERLRSMNKGLSDWLKAAVSGVAKLFRRSQTAPTTLTDAEASNVDAVKTRVAQHVTRLNEQSKDQIRAAVRDAVEQGLNSSQLMLKLSSMFRGQVRDWLRVARTELQAAHNEAAAARAIELGGTTTRVARVPESDACAQCKRLYLGANGRPRIWTLSTLVDNDTNYGKKPDDWLATLHPLHPNCRCGTVYVPDGYTFNASWQLVPE